MRVKLIDQYSINISMVFNVYLILVLVKNRLMLRTGRVEEC